MQTQVAARGLFSKKRLPGATASEMAAAHRYLQSKHDDQLKQLHSQFFNTTEGGLKGWRARRNLVKAMKYHNKMSNAHGKLVEHHEGSNKYTNFALPSHTDLQQFAQHPPTENKVVTPPPTSKPAAPEHEEDDEEEQEQPQAEPTVTPEDHAQQYNHHTKKLKFHEEAKANLIERYKKEKDPELLKKINTAIQQHHAQWAVHNKQALHHQQKLDETRPKPIVNPNSPLPTKAPISTPMMPQLSADDHKKLAKKHNDAMLDEINKGPRANPNVVEELQAKKKHHLAEAEKLSKVTASDIDEVIARSIFSRRVLPGATHGEMQQHHQQASTFHANQAQNLRSQFLSQPNRSTRRQLMKQIKFHNRRATKFGNLSQYHRGQANHQAFQNAAPVKPPIAPAAQPASIPPVAPTAVSKPINHPVSEKNTNWMHSKSAGDRFDYARKNPTSDLAKAHNSKQLMPGKTPQQMQQYHTAQSTFHNARANDARGLLKNNPNHPNKENINKFIDAHQARASNHENIANHFQQQIPNNAPPDNEVAPAQATTSGNRALKFFNSLDGNQKQQYAETHPTSPLATAHIGATNLPYTSHQQMHQYLNGAAQYHTDQAKQAAQQLKSGPMDDDTADKLKKSIQRHQTLSRAKQAAAQAHLDKANNNAAPSPNQVVPTPKPIVPPQPVPQSPIQNPQSVQKSSPVQPNGPAPSQKPLPITRPPPRQFKHLQPPKTSNTMGTPSSNRKRTAFQ